MITLTTILAVACVALFIAGLVIGWMYSESDDISIKMKARGLIATAVTIIWAITIIAEILIAAYTVSPLIHGIMGAIVGYFFTEDGLNLGIGGE